MTVELVDLSSVPPGQWLIALASVLLYVVPIAIILRRLGIRPWVSVIFLVPFLNVIALWAIAYSKWPIADAPRR